MPRLEASPTTPAVPTQAPTVAFSPTPAPLPDREELRLRFTEEIQPLVDTLLIAEKDPSLSIGPDDEMIYIPTTERLYAIQSILGFTGAENPGARRRVYVLYEVLRGMDLVWNAGDGNPLTRLPNTQAVITTLRLIVETDGQYVLIERVDGAGGEGASSFEELIAKSVLPFEQLPAGLQAQVQSDLELIVAYACGIDIDSELDLTRRATALSLTLESNEWADKEQGLAALGNLPSLPESLIPTLLAYVDHDPRYTRQIGELLSKMGADEDTLTQAIQDAGSPDPKVRREAARLLGNIPGDQAEVITVLVKLARDEDDEVGMTAVDSLVNIGAPAVEALIEVLQDPDMGVRQKAAFGLGQLKDARAIQPLAAAMRAGDSDLCWAAAGALGNLGSEAVEPLISLLRDQDPQVRANAASALGIAGDPRAVEPLIMALQDASADVRHNSAKSLGMLNDPRAVLPIAALLKDDDQWVKEQAIMVLEQFRDPRAVDPLIAAFEDKEWRVRSYASQALAATGSPAVEPLLGALASQNADIRYWSAQTLMKLADPRAVEPLLARLRLRDMEVIAGAYELFIAVGETCSEQVLISALQTHGSKEMADAFLNSGNSLLDQAARDWAKAHNYTIRANTGRLDYPVWGSKK